MRAALAAIATVLIAAVAAASVRAAAAGPHRVAADATYYGWFDNTPPGCATAYSGCAGGTGTFADPITFASDTAEFPIGTVLYDPTVRKYFVMGDDCQECDLDWAGHGPDGGPHLRHVDLWLGGQGGSAFAAINCEDALTGSHSTTFVADPPDDEPVSAQPLFDPATGRCFGGAHASSSVGRYRNRGSGACLADVAAATAPCDAGAATRITYVGAFLVHAHRCLKTTSGRDGAPLTWSACDGDAREQWDVNPNGTITWVQYTRCVADERGALRLATCAGSRSRWRFEHP